MAYVAGTATHVMLFGGSRSGKTFLHVRNVIFRALKAPRSRHCILRFRFNHIKSSIIFDTFPKVMEVAFPEVKWKLNKSMQLDVYANYIGASNNYNDFGQGLQYAREVFVRASYYF